jgi:hypothetical protein
MLSKIKFKDEWDELCPIYRKIDSYKTFEQIGTGILIDMLDSVFLLTASHVIDFIYEENDKLFIPTEDGFHLIEGELFHNPLTYSDKFKNPTEYRKNDNVDFSYYRLSLSFISKICKQYIPLKENQIDFSSNFSLNLFQNSIKQNTRASHIKNKIKEYREIEYSDEEINLMDDIKINITITFAGYPLTKTRYDNGQFKSEIIYYHGIALNESDYISNNYDVLVNILAEFGKKGSLNSNFQFINSPKKDGISGGGVYKIIRTDNGFDRKLIGIAHQKDEKKHLLIGTNINRCIKLMKEKQIMPYEVYQRLISMREMLFKIDE